MCDTLVQTNILLPWENFGLVTLGKCKTRTVIFVGEFISCLVIINLKIYGQRTYILYQGRLDSAGLELPTGA